MDSVIAAVAVCPVPSTTTADCDWPRITPFGELTCALCASHHRGIDRGLLPDTLALLRWEAVQRFAAAHQLTPPSDDPLGAIRQMVAALD